MLNFTIGPVAMDEEIRKIGAEQIPYFRTPEFSELMLENETLMKRYMGAGEGARVLFLTGSGTASGGQRRQLRTAVRGYLRDSRDPP